MQQFKRFQVVFLLAIFSFMGTSLWAQPANSQADNAEFSVFDYGKMWTFEYAPTEYFKKTYDLDINEEWMTRARQSSLRFASFCSASFISKDGLVMTNHHCSRGTVGPLQKEGEAFDENGFYAKTLGEERRAEGLYVKQLMQIADITEMVQGMENMAGSDAERLTMRDSAFSVAIAKYEAMSDWAGLEIEPVNYYNGGRYSLYGYKRYDDVRLVWIPSLQLGYYGGDPDNFTYPRYNLDATFWRVYENGKPLNTENFYFPFNAAGAEEGDPVFVIGNPGSTERLRTMAQLEYDRDYRYKTQVQWMKNRVNIMQEQYNNEPDPELLETIFGISNGVKAITGIVEGLNNPELMSRKQGMENYIRSKSPAVKAGNDYWQQMADAYAPLGAYSAEIQLLGPTPLNGASLMTAHALYRYQQAMEGGAGEEDLKAMKEQVIASAAGISDEYEQRYLSTLLQELQTFTGPEDKYFRELMTKSDANAQAEMMLSETVFTNSKKLMKLLDKPKKLAKSKDPIVKLAKLVVPQYYEAANAFRNSSPARRALEQKVGNEIFQVYGLGIPPDATFTLRLADGIVAGYDYNGTTAPYKTTYFGLYDRYYSNNKTFPWSLPKHWENPSLELLRSPLNMVSTNDIIGGNSGSPLINQNLEVVGLVFDGNIESLPGNFIFDPKVNRTVSVHAGGIMAALKYVWKADRIVKELEKK